jgi:hypothetical protein
MKCVVSMAPSLGSSSSVLTISMTPANSVSSESEIGDGMGGGAQF